MRPRSFLPALLLVGCSKQAATGAGGSSDTATASNSSSGATSMSGSSTATSSPQTSSSSAASTSATTDASSSSSGAPCVDSQCPPTESCNILGQCAPCPDPMKCPSCYPNNTELVAACNASAPPHFGCTMNLAYGPPPCGAWPVICNWSATSETCVPSPSVYCRDMYLAPMPQVCPGSRVDPP